MDVKSVIDQWALSAEKDWLACKHLFQAKDYPQSLFWGHLVLEKILKALIVKKTKKQSPFSHDLKLLAQKAGLKLEQAQSDQLNEINTFNQFARYDNALLSFGKKCTDEYAKKYFKTIENLYLWLKEFLQNQN